jgi:hypothetical protein
MDEFEKFKKQQKKAAASIFEMGQERVCTHDNSPMLVFKLM